MEFKKGLIVGAFGVLAAGMFGGSASAAVYYPVSVTASSEFAGGSYNASNAIDGNLLTDWATNGVSTGGTLDMTFAMPLTFTDANITDRTTSGGPQGSYGGMTIDFTTKYSIQAFTDSTFTTAVGPLFTNTVTTPASPTSPASFESTLSLGGITAQYLQYTILASNNSNPGLADINFDASLPVPEPASMLLLGVGLAGAAAVRTRRKNAL